ncbi:MAG: molybdenum cofactor biosynthesis protein MoaE [Planctomycetota bacterium]
MTQLVALVDSVIQEAEWYVHLNDDDIGAHIWFRGVTRATTVLNGDRTRIQKTETLYYEAHRPMAEAGLQQLADSAVQRFDVRHVVIVHRLGAVPVGQCSVLVGCGSAHRSACIEAVAWIMDTLKQEIPIWKQERFQSGSTCWVHPGADEPDGTGMNDC